MESQFYKEMHHAFDHGVGEMATDTVLYGGNSIKCIVDIDEYTDKRIRGGRHDVISVDIHLDEEVRSSAGIKKGTKLDIPSREIRVRVEKLGNYAGGQRTLHCEQLNQV